MLTVVLTIIVCLAGIFFLVLLLGQIANYFFNKRVAREVKEFLSNDLEHEHTPVTKADLEGLPQCVQKWLAYSRVIGQAKIRTVHLTQRGAMRLKPEQAWMPFTAVQYVRTDRPGFIWQVKVKAAPLFFIVGRDKYYAGKGNMLIKLLALLTVADGKGQEIDQGTMLRYLAEMVWYPSAALNDYITWEEIDAASARATMNYQGVKASGVFTFNQKGEAVNFVAQRYMESKGRYTLETWSTPMGKYQEFNGFKIATKGQGVWKLKTGDFNWFRAEITDIAYDISMLDR